MGCMERVQFYVCLQYTFADCGEMVQGTSLCSLERPRLGFELGNRSFCRDDWGSLSLGFSWVINWSCSYGWGHARSSRPSAYQVGEYIPSYGSVLMACRLIIIPASAPKRSLMSQFRTLQSYFCPSNLIAPTILHSMVSPTISHSTPLLLRSHLGIDPVLTPSTYQLASFMSKTAELFLKLPLETVLRRAQVAALKEEIEMARIQGQWEGDLETTVRPGEYRGIMGTMWLIVREEGFRETPIAAMATKKIKGKLAPKQVKGQGLPGLWRGWRVGMWGLVGIWSSRALNLANSGNGGEF
jgi:hypothetical protein